MDTRTAAVLSGLTGAFHANVARVLAVDGHWGVPVGAQAVTGNLTVTGQTGGGYIAVSPDGATAGAGHIDPQLPAGRQPGQRPRHPARTGSGDTSSCTSAATGKTTQLILDLSGYFE